MTTLRKRIGRTTILVGAVSIIGLAKFSLPLISYLNEKQDKKPTWVGKQIETVERFQRIGTMEKTLYSIEGIAAREKTNAAASRILGLKEGCRHLGNK